MLLQHRRPRPINRVMHTVSYIERKNFVKFDNEHYLLYLNEEKAEVKNEETGESVQGFSYTRALKKSPK